MEFVTYLNSIATDTRLFLFFFSFLCLVFELTNPGLFYFLSASITSFIVGIISLWYPISIATQCLFFMGFLCISFIILQWIVHSKYIFPKEQYKSHLAAMVQKEGIVISEISANVPGQVCIKNEIWLAYPDKLDVKITVGKKVLVVGMQGVHIIVKLKE